jgi:plastocyanin
MRLVITLAVTVLSIATIAMAANSREGKKASPSWLPDEMPLPLPVKRPQDLDFKRVVEREYLLFNLLAGGKVAWDDGRYAEAADHWETLLQLNGLDPEIDKIVRPLAIEARQKAGQASTIPVAPPPKQPEPEVKAKPRRTAVNVTGTITGGSSAGPGGAVVSLKRSDAKPQSSPPEGHFVMSQLGKEFVPHILAVQVGSSVDFRNDDAIFHNVFTPSGFDLGLYKAGVSKTQTFTRPGATPLFCNIHAHMNAWIVAVDTPYFAVADASGRFTIRNVPPGSYAVEVWHEGASKVAQGVATVASGMEPLSFAVGNDRHQAAYPPDKYGKPRQSQLGY